MARGRGLLAFSVVTSSSALASSVAATWMEGVYGTALRPNSSARRSASLPNVLVSGTERTRRGKECVVACDFDEPPVVGEFGKHLQAHELARHELSISAIQDGERRSGEGAGAAMALIALAC